MSDSKLLEQFCVIQLQVLQDREIRLRKEMQDCLIQREYLSHFLSQLGENNKFTQLHTLIKEMKFTEDK